MMNLRQLKTMTASVLVAGALLGPVASGEEIYASDDPFGGATGVWGFDVHNEQSVAVQFIPEADFHLDRVSLWLWNNDASGETTPIRISLQVADGSFKRSAGVSFGVMPGNDVVEEWTMDVPYTGFANPLLFEFPSSIRPRIEAGMNYWIVATSPAEGGRDPVWAVGQPGLGFGTTGDPRTGEWYPGMEGSVGAMVVEGTPAMDMTLGQRSCGGFDAAQCGEDEFCKYAAGECLADYSEGLCTPYPEACPLGIWDPLCGCNGQTYGNECEAEMDGVSIDHWGTCD